MLLVVGWQPPQVRPCPWLYPTLLFLLLLPPLLSLGLAFCFSILGFPLVPTVFLPSPLRPPAPTTDFLALSSGCPCWAETQLACGEQHNIALLEEGEEAWRPAPARSGRAASCCPQPSPPPEGYYNRPQAGAVWPGALYTHRRAVWVKQEGFQPTPRNSPVKVSST